MNNEEIKKLLESTFKNCDVDVLSDGNHFQVTLVGEHFEGMSRVKRQQDVYRCLNDLISSGDIHAVQMRLFTPEEFERAGT